MIGFIGRSASRDANRVSALDVCLTCYNLVNCPSGRSHRSCNAELTRTSHMRNPPAIALGRELPMSTATTQKTRILVVEDEADIADLIKHSLERAPEFVVSIAATGEAAMRALTDDVPDLMVLDLNLPII